MFAAPSTQTPATNLQWDISTHKLLAADIHKLSPVEAVIMSAWQDHLDKVLGWEHPRPANRSPLLPREVNAHSGIEPQPEHRDIFKEFLAGTPQVRLGTDRYALHLLEVFTFTPPRNSFVIHATALDAKRDSTGISYDGQRVVGQYLSHEQAVAKEAKRTKRANRRKRR